MRQDIRRPPAIEAPRPVVILALAIIAAHVIRVFSPIGWQSLIFSWGSLQPDRFWATLGLGAADSVPYSSFLQAFVPLVSSAFVHDGWGAAILNAALVVIFGRLVYASLSIGRRSGTGPFLMVFAASVAAGALLHALTQYPAGSALIGASGGASGLFAAWILIQEGRDGRIRSKRFATIFLFFAAINLALWLVGPSILGARISWQAHIGGFLAGALVFQWFRAHRPVRRI